MLFLKPQADRYPQSFGFLQGSLPNIRSQAPDVWAAFLRNSHLSDADATAATAMNGAAPLVFAQDLNAVIWSQFDPEVPSRIEISNDVLDRFEGDSNNPDARRFLQAKALHEMCHWGCFRNQVPDPDTAGETFEAEVFQTELQPWWQSGSSTVPAPPAGLSAASAPVLPAIDPRVFTDPQTRAVQLRMTLKGHVPGRSFDPKHQVFGGADVAAGLPRGYRNNNPGNIRVGISWNGLAEPGDETPFQQLETSFCVFREPEWGLRALGLLMRSYKNRHGIVTPRKIIERWAPASDNNDVDSYSTQLAKALGVGVDDTVDADQDDTCLKMMQAIATHENGSKPPYSDMQFATALQLL